MIADGDDRNERWHEHDPIRCSDEIPPCSFETARRLLWRDTNNELLPVYDHQLCECYLQQQILRCECLGDNKWILISLKSEFVTQIWGKTELSPTIRHKISINRLFVSKPSIVFDYTGIGILVSGGHLSHDHCYGDSSQRIEHFKYFWGILCRVYV